MVIRVILGTQGFDPVKGPNWQVTIHCIFNSGIYLRLLVNIKVNICLSIELVTNIICCLVINPHIRIGNQPMQGVINKSTCGKDKLPIREPLD